MGAKESKKNTDQISKDLLGDSITSFETASEEVVMLGEAAIPLKDDLVSLANSKGQRGRRLFARWLAHTSYWDHRFGAPAAACLYDPCLTVRADVVLAVVRRGSKTLLDITNSIWINSNALAEETVSQFIERKWNECPEGIHGTNWHEEQLIEIRQVRCLYLIQLLQNSGCTKSSFELVTDEDSYIRDWVEFHMEKRSAIDG